MDRDLWARITDIFDAALDRPAGEREAFLAEACGGDATLLAGVTQLLNEFDRAGTFLDEPVATPVRTLEEGELLSGRYRIEATLGAGGMGVVYRAHDEFVDERVALKALRPELAVDADFVRSFRRELQLSRRITHPHVCRVFDVGIHAAAGRQVHFYTMELLAGETLADRIRRDGPLPGDDAYRVAVELADGLQAAHASGIVHRDFKSANVMLCERGAVITDFGLARQAAAAGGGDVSRPLTVESRIAGTVAYMSPEQLAGERLTPASDIYSFGIVLCEMATGRLPFDDTHIIQAAMQRASETGPDIRALAPRLSTAWVAVIARCLQRDPARRFASAVDVPRRLRPGWRPPMADWSRRQWAKAAIAGGAAAAGLAALPPLFRFASQDAVLPEGAPVLLGAITNSTGEPRFEGITELLRNQLAQSVRFNVIDPRDVRAALRGMGKPEDTIDAAAVREAGWRLNAVLSIFGDVSRVGADYAVHLKVEARGSQPDTPRTASLRSFTASDPAALMGAVRDASRWVREAAGESAASIASFDRLPADATTPSWEALTYFARGQQLYLKNDWEPATLEFEAALREDPGFTLAAMRRADILMSQGRQTVGIVQWRDAIAMLEKRRVTRAEELYGRGMFAFDSGDTESAERYTRTWSTEYPYDWRAPYFRAIPLCLNGQAAQAVQILEPLRKTLPDFADLYMQLIGAHLVLGQTAEARALLPIVRRIGRPERTDLREAYILFREADCSGCLEVLRKVQRSSYRRGAADAMLQEALLLIDAGYPAQAAANVERFLAAGSWVETVPQERALRVAGAWAEMLAARDAAAVDQARRALGGESDPMITTLIGTIFARCRARALALEALETTSSFQDIRSYQIARHRIRGELARAEGRADAALGELRAAAALEPPIAHRHYLLEALPRGHADRGRLALDIMRIPWQTFQPPGMHHIGAVRTAIDELAAAGIANEFAARFTASSQQLGAVI
jgi:tetratricopeptide (TPR) repeat protein